MGWHDLLLFAASILAGAINSVAGGGTFFAFPALIFAGVPPVAANVTATIAVWPGAVASAWAYRNELKTYGKQLPLLFATSLIGGVAGAFLLLNTSGAVFEQLIPWLLLLATLLFTFGARISAFLHKNFATLHSANGKIILIISILLQLIIAIYGGYFGAGIGILMLAMLALMGMANMHEMNALKTLLGSAINGVAVVIFIWQGAVHWPEAILMAMGAIIGGYFGANYARTISTKTVKQFVVISASVMTLWFFMN